MEAYINSQACISHYNTISEDFFFEETSAVPVSNSLSVTGPDYKNYIPANSIRRASHILKMGISAGLMCLRNSGEEKTDAIVVGTAMGCFEDTDKFLRSMDENNERTLTPTSFIQSTHNTVAGQIALFVKCHGYNFTYVHQNLSFEYALLDALLLLKEEEAKTVLVGGVDELIPSLFELFDRAGHIKNTEDLSKPLWTSTTKGYVTGEGATFFNLSKESTDTSIAKINGVKTFQHISDANALLNESAVFLNEIGLKLEDISLVLSGINGDSEKDRHLLELESKIDTPFAYFKQFCGEYFTSGSFALWFASSMLQKQIVPANASRDEVPKKLKHILILNHYHDALYSMICVSQC